MTVYYHVCRYLSSSTLATFVDAMPARNIIDYVVFTANMLYSTIDSCNDCDKYDFNFVHEPSAMATNPFTSPVSGLS